MKTRIILPVSLLLILSACSLSSRAKPITTTETAATTTTTEIVSSSTAETVPVAATTEPTTTPAPTTAPPATTVAAATPGDLKVVAIDGAGVGLTDPKFTALADATGLTADSPAQYVAYGGMTGVPFFNLPNGRLIALDSVTDPAYQTCKYHYVVQIAAGTTPEQLLAPVLEKVKSEFPDFSVSTGSGEEEGQSYAGAELTSPDSTFTVTVAAFTLDDNPTGGQVRVEMDSYKTPATVSIPEAVQPKLQPVIDQIGLTGNSPVSVSVSRGVDFTNSVSYTATVEIAYEGDVKAEWQRIRDLLPNWSEEDYDVPENNPMITNDVFEIQVDPPYSPDNPNVVSIRFFE